MLLHEVTFLLEKSRRGTNSTNESRPGSILHPSRVEDKQDSEDIWSHLSSTPGVPVYTADMIVGWSAGTP